VDGTSAGGAYGGWELPGPLASFHLAGDPGVVRLSLSRRFTVRGGAFARRSIAQFIHVRNWRSDGCPLIRMIAGRAAEVRSSRWSGCALYLCASAGVEHYEIWPFGCGLAPSPCGLGRSRGVGFIIRWCQVCRSLHGGRIVAAGESPEEGSPTGLESHRARLWWIDEGTRSNSALAPATAFYIFLHDGVIPSPRRPSPDVQIDVDQVFSILPARRNSLFRCATIVGRSVMDEQVFSRCRNGAGLITALAAG